MNQYFKQSTLALLFMLQAGIAGNDAIRGKDTSKHANTRLPVDHEAKINNAIQKRYRKAVKFGYEGTLEEFVNKGVNND